MDTGNYNEYRPFSVIRGCLIVNFPSRTDFEFLQHLSDELSQMLYENSFHGVILNLYRPPLLDNEEFSKVEEIYKIIKLMGSSAIISGISPGIAAFLAESDVEAWGMETALTIDSALQLLESRRMPELSEVADAEEFSVEGEVEDAETEENVFGEVENKS